MKKRIAIGIASGALALVLVTACAGGPQAEASGEKAVLKEAKLNIEHNATDGDTGFQGFLDGEGWSNLQVTGPGGLVLRFQGKGSLRKLGLTELFFETVEPENADLPIRELLAMLPEGEYLFEEAGGLQHGKAWLTHRIPAGPVLVSPPSESAVPASELVVSWKPVIRSLTGQPLTIIAYQLIIEKDEPPHPHMIGKRGLSMYLPARVTSITVPEGVLEPGTHYKWEVLAIEESGNQTLSSSQFETLAP
jgi:hypothetical protein